MLKFLRFKKNFLLFGDIVILGLSFLLTLFFGFQNELNKGLISSHFLPFSILYLFWLAIFYIFGLYDLNLIKTRLAFYPRVFGGLFVCLILAITFFYLVPIFGITPKTNLALNILIFGALVLIWRKLFYSLFSFHFINRTAIVGDNPQAEALTREITNRPYLGYKIIKMDPDIALFRQIQDKNIDTVIVSEEVKSNPKILQQLYSCLPAKKNILNFSGAYEIICEMIPVTTIDLAWFLENLREGEKWLNDKIKRWMDAVFALVMLCLTLPLWLLIALAIKLEDKGPIFYLQERIGKNGNPFFLKKFRSMKEGAEKETGAVWAKKEDARVTKIGKFLRRSHLDELPQLLNIIKGELSLVGPRPERPEFIRQLEKEIPYYHIRHIIKPGLTGWAQLKFRYARSVMDSQKKFQYDLYYLKNRNVFLDFGILLKTFQLFFLKQ